MGDLEKENKRKQRRGGRGTEDIETELQMGSTLPKDCVPPSGSTQLICPCCCALALGCTCAGQTCDISSLGSTGDTVYDQVKALSKDDCECNPNESESSLSTTSKTTCFLAR